VQRAAANGASSLAAGYIGLMTETPPTKPPLPPLRERLKLPDNCVDVTDQHVGERLVISATATAQCDEGEDDPLLEWMRSAGVAITRDFYIVMNWGADILDPWTPEHEAELPEFLREVDDDPTGDDRPPSPPLPPLRERLKLSDRFVDVTDQHIGEVFVLTNPGSVDGSARGAWIKKDELSKVLPPGFLPPKK